MKVNSPQYIAFFFGIYIAVIACVFSYLIVYIDTSYLNKYLLAEFISLFVISFIVVYFILRRMLINKIKPLYRIINASGSAEHDSEHDIKEKAISEVEEDVAVWAARKVREINQLRKTERYRQEFLGNVSHELKTPIFNIQGYVSTLLDGGLDDPGINKKYLKNCDKSINRMISIVQDLETISHLESGELELQFENFNLYELVREVLDMQELKARQKKIKLQITGTEKNIIVYADRKRIMEVLINLVVNSISYGKDEGKTTAGFFDLDDRVLVEVTDTGIGINEKSLPRIFERFYRVDKGRSRDEGGTGLGLSIVKHIIEAHNQQVSVRSKQGEGSSFAFTLQKAKK